MYDTIIVGVGGMGSAAAWQLARRGQRILALEQFDIPHAQGSSHGVTRIIRLPYYEDPAYVPLLRRAYMLWRELERVSGERVLHITGSLDGGPEDGGLFQGALRSAQLHNLAHEILDPSEVAARFPAYTMPAGFRFLYQPEGGFVASERAIVAHVNAALAAGAHIRAREQLLSWDAPTDGEGVHVTTTQGSYHAGNIIFTAGAWMAELLPILTRLAVPERQVLAWLQPSRPEIFKPDRFPVFNLDVEEGRYYGLPIFEVPGFKFGRYHHKGEVGKAGQIRRPADAQDERLLRQFAARYFPTGNGPTMALRDCMFTNTPDEHFIIDRHPERKQVILASPCSGHGYKFCSVIGEILADLTMGMPPSVDIAFLGLNRFQ